MTASEVIVVLLKSYLGLKFMNTGLPETSTVFPSVRTCEISNSWVLHQKGFHPILYRNTKTWCFTRGLVGEFHLRFSTVWLRY